MEKRNYSALISKPHQDYIDEITFNNLTLDEVNSLIHICYMSKCSITIFNKEEE